MPAFATEETLCSLAAMILSDGEAEITADNIAALIKATGNEVAPYWPTLFAGFLKNGKAEELILTGGAMGGGGGGAAGPAAAGGDAAAAEDAPAEKPKEEEVDAFEGGMDMFGGGGGDY